MDESNDKERINIDFAIDPKCQGDLQIHMDYPDHSEQFVAQSKLK